ncbi:sensor histidine kinase response regulator [Alternaria burnsii]|uniref:Sensor histidine kinase response regulator n=1 Tax=Alternaria burnsii TaxID=1187904 RepID=A0A8H7B3T9_9PLEO|nr:sensor histidine kinase response regulator [Alternaria burnsii]KAF7672323.1 sensor histidine kinase response regulator [Alternaria burnsii]
MSQQPNDRREIKTDRHGMRRERDVLLLYGAAFRNIPRTDNVESHVPRPSLDSTLTALCQLTAIRMGAQRSMISLLDEERQHILAEATCDLPLQPDGLGDASNTLWLGNVSIPRSWGICEKVLKLGPNVEPILVISDLTTDQRSCFREDVESNPDMRFYASVALKSPNGATVGTLCIFDNKSRDGLSKEEAELFKDLGSTVVSYLNTYTISDQYRRGERFTRGLVSFAEGASALVPFEREVRQDSASSSQTSSDISSTTDKEIVSTDDTEKVHEGVELNETTSNHPLSAIAKTARAKSARHRSIRSLQDSILPNDSKSMFSRAANVIMGSSDLDGVLILDASVAASGGHRRANSASGSGTEAPSESYQSRSSSDDASSNSTEEHQRSSSSSSSKMCQLLGVATPSDKENPEYGTLLEPDLSRLFHEYPHGKIFTFCAEGHSLSSTEESTSNPNDTGNLSPATSSKRKTNGRPQRGSTAIKAMFPKARSVAFVPFWDFERARWFAGCLCWSNDAYRLLSTSVDLAYFKIFSHSIMRELSRLDAVALNQAKTTFVASISHELRSPLHGILGTLEFIKDTPLDSFQTSMMNSLHACGSTLLDTINHVMDYAKISDAKKSVSSKRLKNANTIRLSSKPLKNRRRKDPAFDLTIATEEVVEAVFSGSSYIPVTSKLVEAPSSPTDEYAVPFPQRKTRFIILDMAFDEDWVFSFPIGSWRRIVMNLFGNAIKYTDTGYIHVSLRSSKLTDNTNAPTAITLTITDTGSGMSPGFLANRIFHPFSQEDSHAPGTGLGLSIVRQIIDTNGGKVEVSSDPQVGTKLIVKLALTRPEAPVSLTAERAQYLSHLPRLKGRRICILRKKIAEASENTSVSKTDEGLLRFTNALADTLETQLKMQVVKTTEWGGHHADIVICPELSFEYLATIRKRRAHGQRAPVTVFVGMDALEAATLRSDVRVTNRESVVEIITQPCGPYKLAYVLNRCLDRFDHPAENWQYTAPTSQSLQPLSQETKQHTYPSSPTNSLQSTLESLNSDASGPVASSTAGSTTAQPSVTSPTEEEDPVVSHTLIVDDNLLNRRLLIAYMKKNGLQFEEASNGQEALDKYREGSRKFDVILMDMSMPVMDGMSATRAIREHERDNNMPRSSIVALTGLVSSSAKLEAWSSGIDHFMTKPVNFKALGELLKNDETRRHTRMRSTGIIRDAATITSEDGQAT